MHLLNAARELCLRTPQRSCTNNLCVWKSNATDELRRVSEFRVMHRTHVIVLKTFAIEKRAENVAVSQEGRKKIGSTYRIMPTDPVSALSFLRAASSLTMIPSVPGKSLYHPQQKEGRLCTLARPKHVGSPASNQS